MRRTAAILVGLIVTAGVVGACSGDEGSAGSGAAPAQDAFENEADAGNDTVALGETAGSSEGTGAVLSAPARSGTQIGPSLAQAPGVGPSVVKTAELELEVEHGELQEAVNRSIERAGRNGGFVVTSTIEDTRLRTGTLTVRVPFEDFEPMLGFLEALGDIRREVVNGRDVSQEFIDLGARIRNFQAQEAVVLRLMRNADSISETIRIQNELQTVRLEIARLRGRLRFLRDQAEIASVSIHFSETGAPAKAPARLGLLAKAWDRAVAAAVAIASGVIVGLGILVPLLVLGGLVYVFGRAVVRALRPRFGSTG